LLLSPLEYFGRDRAKLCVELAEKFAEQTVLVSAVTGSATA
jgi:hypothetical protein